MAAISIYDYFSDKRKGAGLTTIEEDIFQYYLQLSVISHYFTVSYSYLDKNAVRNEVKRVFPSWTGFEDLYWFCYNYEGFGNALYSFKEAWTSIIRLLFSIDSSTTDERLPNSPAIKNFPIGSQRLGVALINFINNQNVKKVLADRNDSIHAFGTWRKEISKHLTVQDWNSVADELRTRLQGTKETIELLNSQLETVLITKIQNI